MLNGIDDNDARIILEHLSENDVKFLKSINSKQELISEEIEEVEKISKKIEKKIIRDKKKHI